MANIKYTREQLAPIVQDSLSVSEVCRKLGIRSTGSMNSHIAARIDRLGLDRSHFLGTVRNQGKDHRGGPAKKRPEEILVLRTTGSKETSHRLRRALIESGRVEICEECGIGTTWNGKPLVLPVDHKNGNPFDNRPENVRFLCPNCHSQTETFGFRNTKKNAGLAKPADAPVSESGGR